MRLFILILILINTSFANFITVTYNDILIANRVEAINKKIDTLKDLNALEKIKAVNSFFNSHIKYTSDLELYGQNDYRATIEETVLTMKGDCDDFVFAKMQALIYLGFEPSKMFIAITKENNGVIHMKLYVSIENKIYVLDNFNKKFRILTIQERALELGLAKTDIFEKHISNRLASIFPNGNYKRI